MNTMLIFLASMLLAAAGDARQMPAPSSSRAADEQELRALIRQYDDARVAKDATAVARILADDFMSITPEGSVMTKAQFIATFTNPASKLQTVERDAINIRFYGDTAVMTSRAVLHMQWPDGRKVANGQVVMTVFAKTQGRWQVVASQGTPVRPAPAGGADAQGAGVLSAE